MEKDFDDWKGVYDQRIVFGPWKLDFDYLRILYEGAGLVASETDNPLIFELATVEKMNVVEFLQKFYVMNEILGFILYSTD